MEPMIDYLASQRPCIVIHVEPAIENCDVSNLEDYLAVWFQDAGRVQPLYLEASDVLSVSSSKSPKEVCPNFFGWKGVVSTNSSFAPPMAFWNVSK